MDKIKDLYQDDLIYIFTRSQLRDLNTDYLAIIKMNVLFRQSITA